MAEHADTTFKIDNWEENDILEANGGPKTTRATVTMSFEGELEGEGNVEWLMGYDVDGGTAQFVGLERVVGTIAGKKGSFVLQHVGTFDGQTANGDVLVVPGSGTDDLSNLEGKGSFVAGMGPDGERSLSLDYDL
jgi:hypothetical protein